MNRRLQLSHQRNRAARLAASAAIQIAPQPNGPDLCTAGAQSPASAQGLVGADRPGKVIRDNRFLLVRSKCTVAFDGVFSSAPEPGGVLG
jgi:hypothetical protein